MTATSCPPTLLQAGGLDPPGVSFPGGEALGERYQCHQWHRYCRAPVPLPIIVPPPPQAYSLQHSKEDRLAYLNHLLGGELALQLLFILYGLLALAFLSGYYVRAAAQVLAVLLPLAILLIDGNIGYWHDSRRVEFWNQMKLIGQNVGIFGAVVILATDG